MAARNPSQDFEAALDQLAAYFEGIDAQLASSFSILLTKLDSLHSDYLKQIDDRRLALFKKYTQGESAIGHLNSFAKKRSSLAIQSNSLRKPILLQRVNQYHHLDLLCGAQFDELRSSFSHAQKTPNPIQVRYPYSIKQDSQGYLSCFTEKDCTQSHPITKYVWTGLYEISINISFHLSVVDTIGRKGSEELEFKKPHGIDVHPTTGNFYVCDYENKRVQILSPDLEYISQIGPKFSNGNEASYLSDVALSPDGKTIAIVESGVKVYICDENGQIKTVLREISPEFMWKFPTYVAFDSYGNLYVSDRDAEAIVQFDSDSRFINFIGTNESNNPVGNIMGITVTNEDIIVALSDQGDAHAYLPDGSYHSDISVGFYGTDNYLARGPNGGFIMSDWDYNYICFFSIEGKEINSISVEKPIGVAVGLDGKILVSNWRSSYLFHVEARK